MSEKAREGSMRGITGSMSRIKMIVLEVDSSVSLVIMASEPPRRM